MALLDNIIAYWKLEESSGNRADEVGSNTLSDINTVTGNTGKLGDAAQFTRANVEYLSISDNTDLSTGDIDFSFSFWLYLDVKNVTMQILSKWLSSGGNQAYVCNYDTIGDRLQFLVSSTGSGGVTTVVANNFGAVSTGTFIFVVCWHDAAANTINIQINNGTVNSAAHSGGVFDGTAEFRIGTLGDENNPVDGRIDAVGFWKKVLSSGERTLLYNSGNGLDHPFPDPPDVGIEGQIYSSSQGVYV